MSTNEFYTEYIEYPTRKALVEGLLKVRQEEGVIGIDVVDLGKTLRIDRLGEEPTEEPFTGHVDPVETEVPEEEVEEVLAPGIGTGGAPAEVEEASQESVEESGEETPTPVPAEEVGVPKEFEETVEDEDLLGEVEETKPKPVITPETSRNELREIVKEYELPVEVPNAGPLQPLRDRIAAALAEKE